jgi:hypothetical protein
LLWSWVAWLSAIAVAPLLALVSDANESPRSSWWRAAWPFAALAAAIFFAASADALSSGAIPIRLTQLGDALPEASLFVAPSFVLAVDTFRRVGLSAEDRTLRILCAACGLWITGTLSTWPIAMVSSRTGVAGPLTAEIAACSVHASSLRIVCGAIAAGFVVLSLVTEPRSARAPLSTKLSLSGLAAWMVGSVATDLTGFAAGAAICASSDKTDPSLVDSFGAIAEALHGSGVCVAIVCWGAGGLAALGSPRGSVPRACWRALWPFLPLLFIVASPAFEPPLQTIYSQQRPDAVWEELEDFEPLVRPRARGAIVGYDGRGLAPSVIGTLSERGELRLYYGDRSYVSRGAADIVEPPRAKHAEDVVELIVDRRVTARELFSAAERLRLFDSRAIVWKSNELSEVSERARQRWAFVEMAGRAVRANEIILDRELDYCDGAYDRALGLRRCEDALVMEEPTDTPVIELLRAAESTAVPKAIVVPDYVDRDTEVVRPIDGLRRNADPIDTRVVPRIPIWSVAAALAFLALTFASTGWREIAAARALARSMVVLEDVGGRSGLAWTRWRAALDRLRSTDAHPFRRRAPPTATTLSPLQLLERDFSKWVIETAADVLWGASRWIATALVACILGILVWWLML